MPMVGTDNTTSFARDTLTATGLILDALATTGSARRSILTQAQNLIYDACANSSGAAELSLASALAGAIRSYEKTGDDR